MPSSRLDPHLDADVLRQEIDPRNLLEEVDAQLRIAGAWMSEGGVAQRCRLAKNQAQVVGALIELKRQGCAESQENGRVLWRALRGTKLQLPQITDVATEAESGRELLAAQLPTSAAIAAPTVKEIPMHALKPREDRATPITEALRGGPLTREQLAEKTGFNLGTCSDTLNSLKAKGRVQRGERLTWSLTSGAAVAPLGSRRSTQPVAPPRGPSRASAAPNGRSVDALRWFLGSNGSVRIERAGAAIDLSTEDFDTLRRAHQVVMAARLHVEA